MCASVVCAYIQVNNLITLNWSDIRMFAFGLLHTKYTSSRLVRPHPRCPLRVNNCCECSNVGAYDRVGPEFCSTFNIKHTHEHAHNKQTFDLPYSKINMCHSAWLSSNASGVCAKNAVFLGPRNNVNVFVFCVTCIYIVAAKANFPHRARNDLWSQIKWKLFLPTQTERRAFNLISWAACGLAAGMRVAGAIYFKLVDCVCDCVCVCLLRQLFCARRCNLGPSATYTIQFSPI